MIAFLLTTPLVTEHKVPLGGKSRFPEIPEDLCVLTAANEEFEEKRN